MRESLRVFIVLKKKITTKLVGSGAILNESIKAKEMLNKFGISAEVWSATSFNLLRKDGMETEREKIMNPLSKKETYLDKVFNDSKSASGGFNRLYACIPRTDKAIYFLGLLCFRNDGLQKRFQTKVKRVF